MNERQRLVQTLVGVYGFYDKELTEFAIRIWADSLAGVDPGTAEQAFTRHLRNPDAGRWLPKPADILRQLAGDVGDRALIAWGEVLQAAQAGGMLPISCSENTRNAVNAMGGMGVICRANESDNGFLQRRFVDAFKAYNHREESPPLLEGKEILKLVNGI